MILDGEMSYTEVVRLVEMIDFDIKIISIRGRMQKLEPAFELIFHPGLFVTMKRTLKVQPV